MTPTDAPPASTVAPTPAADASSRASSGSRCYLHIGTMKSGTTFVQQMLSHHESALRDDGVLFPGHGKYVHQILAVRDILALPGTADPARVEGAWGRLCGEVATWDGDRSIVSVEQLSIAPAAAIAEIVSTLAPTRVEIVVTARDLARVLPSTWQENIQNGLTWTWPEFLSSIMGEPGADRAAGNRFWRQHDVAQMVRRWANVVGPSRVHVVTLPPSGSPRDLLWERFCSVVGLDPSRYPTDSADLRSNKGLDRAEAEMLRQVNALLGDSVNRGAKLRILKRGLAKTVLTETGRHLPIVLDPDAYAWTVQRSETQVADLLSTGADIVGDIRDLVPAQPRQIDPSTLREPSPAEIADAAVAAATALLTRLGRTTRQGRPAQRASDRERRAPRSGPRSPVPRVIGAEDARTGA